MTQGGTKAKPWLHQEGTMARPWACLGHTDNTQARTWVPQQVWCAPRGRNDMRPITAYLLLALARERLKTCVVSPLE